MTNCSAVCCAVDADRVRPPLRTAYIAAPRSVSARCTRRRRGRRPSGWNSTSLARRPSKNATPPDRAGTGESPLPVRGLVSASSRPYGQVGVGDQLAASLVGAVVLERAERAGRGGAHLRNIVAR